MSSEHPASRSSGAPSGAERGASSARRADQFRTTRWTIVEQARSEDESVRQGAMDELARIYRQPLLMFFVRRTRCHEFAEDLVQEFFARNVIGRELFQVANQEQGRLRSFLATAARNHLIDVLRSSDARWTTRREDLGVADDVLVDVHEPGSEWDRLWLQHLVKSSLETSAKWHRDNGLEKDWALFVAHDLKPVLDGADAVSFRSLADDNDDMTRHAVRNRVVEVRKRVAKTLREQIAETIEDPGELSEELAFLRTLDRSSG